MRRSILTSFVVIGAVLALVMGASTFAVFTDQTTGTADISAAGTVDIVMQSDASDEVALNTLNESNDCNPGPTGGLAGGEYCDVVFTLENPTGNLSADWSFDVSDDESGTDCYSEEILDKATLEAGDAPDGDHNPGDSHDVTLRVTLADDNDCQGATTTVTVTVDAQQSSTPHD